MSDKRWLEDLVEEYPAKDIAKQAKRIKRLNEVFKDEDLGVMSAAVRDYMINGGKYFPKIYELSQHVRKIKKVIRRRQLGNELTDNELEIYDHMAYWSEVAAGTIDPAETYERCDRGHLTDGQGYCWKCADVKEGTMVANLAY